MWLGRPLLERWGRYFFARPELLHKTDAFFSKHGAVSTFTGRLIPGIRHLISIFVCIVQPSRRPQGIPSRRDIILTISPGNKRSTAVFRIIGLDALLVRGCLRKNRAGHLEKTEAFYEKHGGKTVVFARFLPIFRTFAPFVAGVGHMIYTRFVLFSILGAIVWINSLVFLGYFFGNIPIVKNNLTVAILGIIVLSLLPGLVHYLRERARGKTAR